MHFQNSCSRWPDSRGMLCNYLFIDRVSSVASHWCQGDLAEIFVVVLWQAGCPCEVFHSVSDHCVIFLHLFPWCPEIWKCYPQVSSVLNYWTTLFLVEEGFYHFCNWFGGQDWYYLEQVIGGTVYLGLNDYLCCKLPCTSSYPHYI